MIGFSLVPPPQEPESAEHDGDFEPSTQHNASRAEVDEIRVRLAWQMLGPASTGRSRMFYELLSIPHRDATGALAKLALFAPEGDVRAAAIDALKVRPKEDYIVALVDGLRYPLPKVAENAAVAIIRLRLHETLVTIAEDLDRPDPRISDSNIKHRGEEWVQEVVKIPHHRNCMLCHPPAQSKTEAYHFNKLTASVPTFSETPVVKEGTFFGYGGGNSVPDHVAIRFDITYLTQDFSLMRRLDPNDGKSKLVRFDYLVRDRKLTPREIKTRDAIVKSMPNSAYRKIKLEILRKLTGENKNWSSKEWVEYFKETPGYPGLEEWERLLGSDWVHGWIRRQTESRGPR